MIGFVYKIICVKNKDVIFIGKTTTTLSVRMANYRFDFKQWKDGNKIGISLFPVFSKYGIENFKIVEIRRYEVIDKQELGRYEQKWISKFPNCVNNQVTIIGTIYKIFCVDDESIVYIGKTTQTLSTRFSDHKYGFKSWLGGNRSTVSIFPYFVEYGVDNFDIVELQRYEVDDIKDLGQYEQHWIEQYPKCVNKRGAIAGITVRNNLRDEVFKCVECGYLAPNQYKLERHLGGNNSCRKIKTMKEIKDSVGTDTYCNLCEKDFRSPNELHRHNKGNLTEALHRNIINDVAVQCEYCYIYLLNKDCVSTHHNRSHPVENTENVKKRKLERRMPIEQKIINRKDNYTRSFAKISAHNVSNSLYRCDTCDHNFTSDRNLQKHLISKKHKEFGMTPEEKKVRTDEFRRLKKLEHIKNKTYYCATCDIAHGAVGDYKRHLVAPKHLAKVAGVAWHRSDKMC